MEKLEYHSKQLSKYGKQQEAGYLVNEEF